ncbi:ATP-binding cassette domain-containing protein [Patescibacteria group bacterium]|jgi:ABC-2 type transport system ATP-binding protein|nr:ATP-binding cassette domain-containing protein [Patescibacteria group bacterium]
MASSAGSVPALGIEHFTKRYRTGVVAVDDISLTVPRGAFFGFLGPNGAGKTTTISCITGTALPTEGVIEVFGHNVVTDFRAARQEIGVSPQEFNADIFEEPTDILDFVGGYYGMTRAERRARIDELAAAFDFAPYRTTKFRELSGGYKRRVILARAMMHDPDLLILDEPTAGVDVETRRALWTYLRQLNAAGKTIILTSHYLEEIEALCDTVAIIHRGRIVRHDRTDTFTAGGKKLEDVYVSITEGGA